MMSLSLFSNACNNYNTNININLTPFSYCGKWGQRAPRVLWNDRRCEFHATLYAWRIPSQLQKLSLTLNSILYPLHYQLSVT
jgi:hypothetical protein